MVVKYQAARLWHTLCFLLLQETLEEGLWLRSTQADTVQSLEQSLQCSWENKPFIKPVEKLMSRMELWNIGILVLIFKCYHWNSLNCYQRNLCNNCFNFTVLPVKIWKTRSKNESRCWKLSSTASFLNHYPCILTYAHLSVSKYHLSSTGTGIAHKEIFKSEWKHKPLHIFNFRPIARPLQSIW